MADRRRITQWQDNFVQLSLASGAQGNDTLVGDLDQTQIRGLTLLRTLLHIWCYPTTIGGADGAQQIDLGIGVLSREAQIGGVFPDPDTPEDAPARGWVYRDQGPVFDNTAAESFYGSPLEFKADIRAMRKLDQSGTVSIIVDNNPVSGTAFTVRVRALVRCLYMFP